MACASTPQPPPVSGETEVAHGLADAQLLLTPSGDAEALLGRSVTRTRDGVWQVSEGRAPGCKVKAKRTEERWTRVIEEEVDDLVDLSAGAAALGKVRAKYGSHTRSRLQISNVAVLQGDLTGPCGQWVIAAVKIGVGSREWLAQREKGASAEAALVSVGAKANSRRSIDSRLAWSEPQAYAFTLRKGVPPKQSPLQVEMPTRLANGDSYAPVVRSSRDVYLVVFSQEIGGHTAVLFPNPNRPSLAIAAGEERSLPMLRATTPPEATSPSYERLVFYAFTEEEDYLDYRPPLGRLTLDEMQAYADALPQRLEALPQARWSVAQVRYEVHPAPREAAPPPVSAPPERDLATRGE